MTRSTWWLALGLAALVGCDSGGTSSSSGTAGSTAVGVPGNTPKTEAGLGKEGATGTSKPGEYQYDKSKTPPPDALKRLPPGSMVPNLDEVKKEQAEAKSKEEGKDESKDEAKSKEEGKDEGKKDDQASASSLSTEQLANINKLPEAERAAAIAQAVCLVSDEPLGEMGTPIAREVKGQTVYLCCKSCIKELEKDPDAALAKLKKK